MQDALAETKAVAINTVGLDPKILALIKRLRRNDPTLTSLDLSDNKIGDQEVIALANALATNRVLTSLDLRDNRICAPGAIALASALTTNRTLIKLDLRYNKIEYLDLGFFALMSVTGFAALADAIKINNTLRYLALVESDYNCKEIAALLVEAVRSRPFPLMLDVEESSFVSSFKPYWHQERVLIKSIWRRNNSLNPGEECLQRRKYIEALTCFDAFLTPNAEGDFYDFDTFLPSDNSKDIRALLGKGNALLGMDRPFPETSAVFKAVLALAPIPNEQAVLQKLIQQNPAYLLAEVALPFLTARHLFEQGFYLEAFKALEAAQSVAPESTKRELLIPFCIEILSSTQRVSEVKGQGQGDEKREGKEAKQTHATVPSVSSFTPLVGAASAGSSSSSVVLSDISPKLRQSMMGYVNQLTLTDLERYVAEGLNLNAPDKHGKTFFLRMVQANQLALVKILLINPQLKINIQGTTPLGDNALHLAVADKSISLEMIELLVGYIEVDSLNHAGRTPLYQAVDSEQPEKIDLLLQKGANPRHKLTDTESALECAIRKDKVELLEPLLIQCAKGVRIHIRRTINEQQLLCLAASVGAVQILDYFHVQRGDFRIVDDRKRTLLHIAVQASALTHATIRLVVEKLISLSPELLLETDNEGKKAEESTTDATLKALLVNARQKYQRVLDETEQSLEDMERCSRSIVQKVEKRIGRPYQESDSLSNAILSRLTQDLSLAQRLQVFQNIVLQTAFEVQIIQALVEPNVSAHRKKPDIWVGAALDHGKMQGLFLAALNSSSKKEEKTGPTTTATVAAPAPVGGSSAASTTLTVITSASLSSAPQERNAAGEGKSAPSLPTAASALTGMPQAPVSRAALFSTTVSSNSGSSTLSVASPATPSTSSSNSSSSPAVAEGKNSAKERFIQSFAKYFEQCYAFSAVCAHHDVEAKLTPQQETARKALQGGLSFAVDTHSAASVQEFLTAVWKNWKTPNYRRVAYLFADPWNPSERTPIIHEAAKKLAIKYAEPLEKLRDAGIDRLARCAVMRAMDYISSTTDALYVSKKGWGSRAIGWVNTFFNPHVAEPNRLLANPVDVIITGVWKGKSKGVWHKESIARTSLTLAGEMLLETLSDSSSSPWTAEGVITRSGIIVNGCKYIDKRENNTLEHYNEALKYGFCEGSMDEVRERGYQEKRENKASCVVR